MRARATTKKSPGVKITTKDGKPVAVVMKLSQYRALMEHVEDLEDSLEIAEAKRTATKFVSLEQLKKDVAAMRKR